jgi:flagellar motor switch protein FliG
MAALPEAMAPSTLPVPAGIPGLPAVPGFPGADPTMPPIAGREKAATLLVSLGQEQAAEVLQHLPPEEIEAISLEMAKLRTVDPSKTNAVLAEFVHTADAMELAAEGGVDFAREVLERSLGSEGAAEIIARLSATMERRPFEFLRKTPPEQIIAFLTNEAPQTIALVIANLHTTLAAQVLSELEPEIQADVAARVASMAEISPDVLQVVERVIKQKLSSVITQEYAASGGVKSLAEILNHTDRPTERNILDRLAESNADLAEQIRLLLFTFEDIVKLEDRHVQLILREVDQKDLALALRGVPQDVKEKVLKNMSQRGAEMLREEMEYQPPQRRVVVEEAQGRIVSIIRRLEESGDLVLGRAAGEDDVV